MIMASLFGLKQENKDVQNIMLFSFLVTSTLGFTG